ncbi:MAG: GDSL-type esterase/lipase family protein [Acidobacteriaceae bacterium]
MSLPKPRFVPALTVAILLGVVGSLSLTATLRAQTAKAPGAGAGAEAGPEQNPAIVPTDRMSVGWWAARHKQVLAEVASHPDTQLLMIGDSITNNYDKAEPPYQDFQPIWQQYYAPRKALNLGFSGDTTANVLWRLDHGEVAGLHPKLAVVLIGTNNTAFGQSAEDTEVGIDAVVKDIEHRLPETKILLLGVLPSKLPSKDKNFDVNEYLGSHYAGREDPMVSYIDISVVFYTYGQLDTTLFYDPTLTPPLPATHPNTIGQRLMASAIEPAVARLMGDTPVKPSTMPFRTLSGD